MQHLLLESYYRAKTLLAAWDINNSHKVKACFQANPDKCDGVSIYLNYFARIREISVQFDQNHVAAR